MHSSIHRTSGASYRRESKQSAKHSRETRISLNTVKREYSKWLNLCPSYRSHTRLLYLTGTFSIFVCTTLVPILLRLQKLSQVQPERLIQFQSHSNGFYFYVYAEQGARCLVHCSSFTVVGCGDWQRSYWSPPRKKEKPWYYSRTRYFFFLSSLLQNQKKKKGKRVARLSVLAGFLYTR